MILDCPLVLLSSDGTISVLKKRNFISPYSRMQKENSVHMSILEPFLIVRRSFIPTDAAFNCLLDYSNIFSLLTRMRQMACHPDLVLRSRSNANTFIQDGEGESTVCRLCNEFAEDAIQAKCHHLFDRECIKQYLEAAIENQVGHLQSILTSMTYALFLTAGLSYMPRALNHRPRSSSN